MTYRQNTDVFLRNATTNESTRGILQYAVKRDGNIAGTDAYRLHVDWQPDDSIEAYDTYEAVIGKHFEDKRDIYESTVIDIQDLGSYGGGVHTDYMSIVNTINFDTPAWQGEVYGTDLKQALDTAKTFCRPVDTRSYDDSIVTLRIVPTPVRNEPAEIYVSSKNEEGDVETGMGAKQLSRISNENKPLEIKLNWRYLNQARIGLDQCSQDSKIKITYNGAKKPLALGERDKRLVVIMPLSE